MKKIYALILAFALVLLPACGAEEEGSESSSAPQESSSAGETLADVPQELRDTLLEYLADNREQFAEHAGKFGRAFPEKITAEGLTAEYDGPSSRYTVGIPLEGDTFIAVLRYDAERSEWVLCDKYTAYERPQTEPGVPLEQADFLTTEQKELYLRAQEAARSFYLTGLDDAGDGAESVQPDGLIFCKYTGGKYTGWEDYYADMLTVFTPEYYKELNTTEFMLMKDGQLVNTPAEVYRNIDGSLYYLAPGRGSNPLYRQDLDSVELVSGGENEIRFNVIAHYDGNEYSEAYMERHEITLTNTPDGWRATKVSAII